MCLWALPAAARPVSYPGGWTIIQNNNANFSSANLHYSFTAKDALGFYGEQNWATDSRFYGAQYTRLLKRWNGPGSQANIYLNLGAGVAENFDQTDTDLAGFVGLTADWETRRWFVSYSARADDLSFDQNFRQNARLGFAPYVGGFGDLHTWFMIQLDNIPENETAVTATPLIRFFKDVHLFELGYTPARDRFLANYTRRF
ncbi:MAG: hypothetical protein ABJ275_02815 [Maricaulaceae bacterium]